MTLSKVISLADELCPNALSNDVKTAWINEVEGMVQTEVMLFASAEVITYDYERDKDAQLLVNPPHDKLYLPYLLAMLHFANADFDRYHNTITLFNSHYEEFMRWYALNYRPADDEEDM